MAVLLSLGYVGITAGAMFSGKITFEAFNQSVMPLLTAWGGYLAALINKSDGS